MNPVIFWGWSCQAHKQRLPILPRLLKTLIFISRRSFRFRRTFHALAAQTWVGSEHRTLRIGDGAKIGAGGVVTGDVEPGQTVIGSRPVRLL